MMLDEQDEFIQQIMANRDAAMATATESTTWTGRSEGTLVEREVDDADFVRSSRWIAHPRLICITNSTEVVQTPSHPPIPN
jgi:hypothetical protein